MSTKTWRDPCTVHADFLWVAWRSDTDFAPDSPERGMVGYGPTEAAALDDLKRLEGERYEIEHPEEFLFEKDVP